MSNFQVEIGKVKLTRLKLWANVGCLLTNPILGERELFSGQIYFN